MIDSKTINKVQIYEKLHATQRLESLDITFDEKGLRK
jgi:hypothetical protein